MPRSARSADRVASDSARSLWVRRRWFLVAVVATYIACGVIAFRLLDRSTLERALSLPLTLVATLLGLSLINYLVRAWRWLVLSSFLGFEVPPLRNVLYYLAGYALTSTPGKAGEAVRLWFLKAGHGVPYVRSMAIMLADRALDMWAVVILVLVCFADFSHHLCRSSPWWRSSSWCLCPSSFRGCSCRCWASAFGLPRNAAGSGSRRAAPSIRWQS